MEPVWIAFVCVGNSCRSQMAEGFARTLGGPRVFAVSAGSRPEGVVADAVVEAMRARGVYIGNQWSKGIEDLPDVTWDYVITLGCGDACAHLQSRFREDWPIADGRGLDATALAPIRDAIETRVRELLARALPPAKGIGTALERVG